MTRKTGAAKEAADEEFQDLLLPEEREGFHYDAETRKAAKEMTYAGALERLRQVVKFGKDSDYDAVLLFAAMTRILSLLHMVWYVTIAGPKSAGKTTVGRVIRFLSHHMVEAGQLTVASVPAIMREEIGLFVDEVDVLLRKEGGEALAAILRQGTDRETPYFKMEPRPDGGWNLVRVPVWGPKVMTFRRKVDDALQSRADILRMSRARDPKIRRAKRTYRKTLRPVKAWLDRQARDVLRKWTKGAVEEYLESPEFITQSDALKVELDRSGEIGDLMILVDHLYGWDTARVIQGRLGVIEEASEEEVTEEVRGALLRVVAAKTSALGVDIDEAGVVVKKEEVKAAVDAARSRGEKPIWANTVAEVLDDLGFTEDFRFSKADRARAIKVTKTDLDRLSGGPAYNREMGKVGQPGFQTKLPSEMGQVPPSGPTISEPAKELGPSEPVKTGPTLVPPSEIPGPGVGPSAFTDVKSAPGPTCPSNPTFPGGDGGDSPSPDQIRVRLRLLQNQGYDEGDPRVQTLRKMLGEGGA